MENITVLMSTYNGNKYLRKQLDSILSQEDVAISLHIRDDGSTDYTISILEEYSKRYNNIQYYVGKENLGACGSFFELMSKNNYSTADYYALSDQDDVWDKDKLKIALQKLKTLPQDRPALYFSNTRLVDEDLNFIRLAHSKPQILQHKYSFLSEPLPTGCTIVYNRKLAEISREIQPAMFSMHDTWLYMVASLFGKVIYDFEAHISYRQHSKNVVGSLRSYYSFAGFHREIKDIFDRTKQWRYRNAQILQEQFHDKLNAEQLKMLKLITEYKENIKNQIKLLMCREIEPSSFYRKVRFKIKVILRNV